MKKKTFWQKIAVLFVFILQIPLTLHSQQKKSIDDIIDIIKNKKDHPNYVLVAAHRGYWHTSPENSLPAYEKAIEIGVDIVELDVRLTKDKEIVVLHDACLDRVTTGSGLVGDQNWGALRNYNLKDNLNRVTQEKILRVDDALDYLKGKAVASLDIKETGDLFNVALKKMVQMAKDKGMLNQLIIKGKMPYSELQPLLTSMNVSLSDFIYTPVAFSNTPNLDSYIKDYLNTNKIYAFELVYKQTNDPIIKYVEILKLKKKWVGQYTFWPETCKGIWAEKVPLTDCTAVTRDYDFQDKNPANFLDDGRGDWDWLFKHGADYVITDRSELMIDYLKVMGKRIN